ncbi:hypothetical protein DXG01_012498 [Tephrocybe rancida]|nr:hypothetical protein DXG01_012498 [Tephrocybe rancida]
MSPTGANVFPIDDDLGATTNVALPVNSIEAFVEVFCSGNSAEEFWYLNEFVPYFPTSTGITGKGPFREVQILVDGRLAGVIWPYAVIYTGGVTPSNWRPLTSYGAYDSPTYWIDITPFLPTLLTINVAHAITLRVAGQGTAPTINSNWFVSGSVHIRTGNSPTTGKIKRYEVPGLQSETSGGASTGNETVWTKVIADRHLLIESELMTSEGNKTVTFSQTLSYRNEARYADEGWIQVMYSI